MGRAKILVVEDDQISKQLMYHFLKDYDVLYAETVKEAITQIETKPVNCVLLDISLHGNEDGLKISKYIKSEETKKNIPVIATTAHAFTHDRDRCLSSGCDEFLTKPIRKARLLETVEQHLKVKN
ncbi:MAG: response regulator [Candidatus Marinimicrobia bacterium]|nr:response regulator [Candidatus Neomarinimicrobiota bacterium]